MALKLFLLPVLLAVLGYLLYEPMPAGYSLSSSLHLMGIQAGSRAGRFVAATSDWLGIAPGYQVMRTLCRLSRFTVPQPKDDIVRWYETVFDGVPVRVYEPRGRSGVLPGFVYYHGGGWVMCDLDTHHAITHQLALKTNTVLISVDYRLAPEHPFPAAHDDCFAATKYFIENARKFNIDPKRVVIGGDSAGGNLAATVALRLRDEHFTPPIKAQILIYPSVQQIDLMLPSILQNGNGILLHRAEIKFLTPLYLHGSTKYGEEFTKNGHVPLKIRKELEDKYLNLKNLPTKFTTGFSRPEPIEPDAKLWNEIKSTLLNQYFCPLIAPNATGLPPLYVYTGELDLIRDDGILYARKLKDAGNKVEHFLHDLGFHGNLQFTPHLPETQVVMESIVRFVREHI